MAEKSDNIFRRGGSEELRLNLTPMIDAVFLLLIFFMVTTVFTQPHQLRIELPRAVNYDQLKEKKLNISISPEGQLEIKQASPFEYTFVAHMSNGYAGYVPTAAALERGGYETRTSNGSQLAPDALETISNTAIELLEKLSQQD